MYELKYTNMVLCVVIGGSKRSGRNEIFFYRIPKIITSRGKQEYELTKKQRNGFLAAISSDGLEDSRVPENDRIFFFLLYTTIHDT